MPTGAQNSLGIHLLTLSTSAVSASTTSSTQSFTVQHQLSCRQEALTTKAKYDLEYQTGARR